MGATVRNQPTAPDWPGLIEYYNQAAISKSFFRLAAEQLAAEQTSAAEDLSAVLRSKGAGFSRPEVVEFFKRMERLGFGRYTRGRRSHSTRFEWKPLKPGQVRQELLSRIQAEDPVRVSTSEKLEADDAFEHRFRLRPDREISIALPRDLTPSEAGRVADFVRTLPFG